jgi:hypothetical protein
MGFKKRTRNPDIYISEKDMIEFFNIPEKDVRNIINKRLLTPKRFDGKILYRLTELIQASFYYNIDD